MNTSNLINNAENCKVVLIGETGVGKTSIISRFVNNKFENIFMPTPGASFTSKPLYIEEFDKIIKFEVVVIFMIWRYGILLDKKNIDHYQRYFIKVTCSLDIIDAQVAILVYDITRKGTFEEIQKFWCGQVNEYANKNISKIVKYIHRNGNCW